MEMLISWKCESHQVQGFSLLEMMVALIMSVVLLLSLFHMVMPIYQQQSYVQSKMDLRLKGLKLLNLLEQDLQHLGQLSGLDQKSMNLMALNASSTFSYLPSFFLNSEHQFYQQKIFKSQSHGHLLFLHYLEPWLLSKHAYKLASCIGETDQVWVTGQQCFSKALKWHIVHRSYAVKDHAMLLGWVSSKTHQLQTHRRFNKRRFIEGVKHVHYRLGLGARHQQEGMKQVQGYYAPKDIPESIWLGTHEQLKIIAIWVTVTLENLDVSPAEVLQLSRLVPMLDADE